MLVENIGQFVCYLRGHSYMLRLGPSRMWLECPECGHETPGWEVRDHVSGHSQRRKSAAQGSVSGVRREDSRVGQTVGRVVPRTLAPVR